MGKTLSATPATESRNALVFKAPDRVYALEALFSVFPDAMVIQTHRDPLQVLKSSIHLNWVLRRLYGRPDDPIQLAEREARVLAGMTDRLIRFRDARPELAERFVDVNYGELIADPLAVITRIYGRVRFDPDPGGRRAHRVTGLAPVALSRPSFHSRPRRYWFG